MQPHPPTASAEEVGTLAATTKTDVVVDVVEDPHCGEARDDADDADDYYWNCDDDDDDDEVLDVDQDDYDNEECEVVTPSREPISKHPSNEKPASHQQFIEV